MIAAAATTSLTVAPAREIAQRPGEPLEERADRVHSAEVLAQLVADVAGVEVGEYKDVGLARDVARMPGLQRRDPRHDGRVGLEVSVDHEPRSPDARDLHRSANLVDPFVLRAAVGRERQHRHPRGDPEQPFGVRSRGDRDVRERLRVRLHVDRAVGEDKRGARPRGAAIMKKLDGVGDALREAHRHQPRLDDPRRGLARAGHQRVGVACPHRHRGVEQRPREEPFRHPLVRLRPAVDVERSVGVKGVARPGRYGFDRIERDARRCRHRFQRCTLTDQYGTGDALVAQAPRCLRYSRVLALGKDDRALP